MFIATQGMVKDGRQYINIYQDSKSFKNHKLEYPSYTVSVPQENTDEFLKTLEKFDSFTPRAKELYKNHPKKVKNITVGIGAAMTALMGYVGASLLNFNKPFKAITILATAIPGAIAGLNVNKKATELFKKLDELGMRNEVFLRENKETKTEEAK